MTFLRILIVISVFSHVISCDNERGHSPAPPNKWEYVTNVNASLTFLARSGNTILAGSDFPGGVFISHDTCKTWEWDSLSYQNGFSRRVFCFFQSNTSLLIGTETGTYRSVTNGLTWIPDTILPDSNYNLMNECQGFASIGNTIFVALNPVSGGGGHPNMYKSIDDGVTWTVVNPTYYTQLLSLTSIDSTLLVGTRIKGIVRSADLGSTWTLVTPGSSDYFSTFHVVTTGILAGAEHGVWKSTNNGQSWAPFGTGLPLAGSVRGFVTYNGHLYAALYGDGIYTSADDGNSWAPLNDGMPDDAKLVRTLMVIDGVLYSEINESIWKIVLD